MSDYKLLYTGTCTTVTINDKENIIVFLSGYVLLIFWVVNMFHMRYNF